MFRKNKKEFEKWLNRSFIIKADFKAGKDSFRSISFNNKSYRVKCLSTVNTGDECLVFTDVNNDYYLILNNNKSNQAESPNKRVIEYSKTSTKNECPSVGKKVFICGLISNEFDARSGFYPHAQQNLKKILEKDNYKVESLEDLGVEATINTLDFAVVVSKFNSYKYSFFVYIPNSRYAIPVLRKAIKNPCLIIIVFADARTVLGSGAYLATTFNYFENYFTHNGVFNPGNNGYQVEKYFSAEQFKLMPLAEDELYTRNIYNEISAFPNPQTYATYITETYTYSSANNSGIVFRPPIPNILHTHSFKFKGTDQQLPTDYRTNSFYDSSIIQVRNKNKFKPLIEFNNLGGMSWAFIDKSNRTLIFFNLFALEGIERFNDRLDFYYPYVDQRFIGLNPSWTTSNITFYRELYKQQVSDSKQFFLDIFNKKWWN